MAEQQNNKGVLALLVLVAGMGAAWFLLRKRTPPSPSPISLSISPASTAIETGQTVQFAATATLSDGSQQNVTSQSTWNSSNNAVATVSAGGLTMGVTVGIVTIVASYSTLSAQAVLQVTAPLPSGGIEVAGPPVFTVNAVDMTAPLQITVSQFAEIGVRWPARNTGTVAKDAQVQMIVIRNNVVYLHSTISSILPGDTVSVGQDAVPIFAGGTFWVLGDNEAHLHLMDLSIAPPSIVEMFPFTLTITA